MASETRRIGIDSGRNRDLAAIHTTIKQLGMDRETYEAMLQRVAGVASAGDLDARGRRQVLDRLRAVGGQFRRPARASGEWAFVDTAAAGNRPLLRKAIVLCGKLGIAKGVQKAYCEGIMHRQHQVDRHMEMIDHTDLWMLVCALERNLLSKVKNASA